jgi:hypothetical protein
MENRYHNRDFEDFVKQNADQYRMFPSEKVWKNIHNTLHHRNRWYGAGFVLLLLTTAAVTGVMLIPSNKNIRIADKLPVASTTLAVPEAKTSTAPTRPASPLLVSVNQKAPAEEEMAGNSASTPFNPFMADMNDEGIETIFIATRLAPASLSAIRPSVAIAAVSEPVAIPVQSIPLAVIRKPVFETPVEEMNAEIEKPVIAVTDELKPVIPMNEVTASEEVTSEPAAERPEYPMTIESVVNSYKKRKSKLSLQAYFTPTVSYRRLEEDNQFLSETQARTTPTNSAVAISDVENIVTHKPDYGLQLGINAGYSLSPRLSLVTGLQFNVSKYDIRAYNYPSENTTIALMSGGPSVSSLQTQTTYRNYSGSRNADWLHNLYFSAAIPIGLQFRLSEAGRPEVGISGTVQPTYILGNRTYLLTTDYKNYAEVPSLIRKWNISTGFEIYAGITTGKIDWRIGPQVRYQLFSSYKKEYPVKEHLFDFGLKVGIMLSK